MAVEGYVLFPVLPRLHGSCEGLAEVMHQGAEAIRDLGARIIKRCLEHHHSVRPHRVFHVERVFLPLEKLGRVLQPSGEFRTGLIEKFDEISAKKIAIAIHESLCTCHIRAAENLASGSES